MTHAATDSTAAHGTADAHGGGGHDEHGDPRDTHLGPPDTAAWMAGALGALIGLLMAICFALAVGAIPSV